MNKTLVMSGVFCFLTLSGMTQSSLYDYTLQDTKDSVINLNSFGGKKLLLVLLPKVVPPLLIDQLKTVRRRNEGNLNIVGFIASGTTSESLALLKDSLTAVISNIHLTPLPQGHGESPAALKWLMDPGNNRNVLKVAPSPGYAFLVNEFGRVLYVLPPSKAITSPFLQRIIDFTSPSVENQ